MPGQKGTSLPPLPEWEEGGEKEFIMPRRESLVTGEVYHVYSKSIAKFKIFNNPRDYEYMHQLIRYYQILSPEKKLSHFLELEQVKKNGFEKAFIPVAKDKERLNSIIAYCIMPTHIHLLLKQNCDQGIVHYVRKVFDGYSRYFNLKYKRKGPLWEGRFQNRLIETDEQLLHMTRYIHLNPATSFLVDQPEEWHFSSYREYIGWETAEARLCDYDDMLDIKINSYKKFVHDRISYQRELSKIKHLLLEE